MVSEVNGPGSGSVKPVTKRPAAVDGAQTAKTGTATPPAQGENVTLTDLAARIQTLVKSLDQLPEVDQKRVAELRQAISAGNYEIDNNELADKLTRFESVLAKHTDQA